MGAVLLGAVEICCDIWLSDVGDVFTLGAAAACVGVDACAVGGDTSGAAWGVVSDDVVGAASFAVEGSLGVTTGSVDDAGAAGLAGLGAAAGAASLFFPNTLFQAIYYSPVVLQIQQVAT